MASIALVIATFCIGILGLLESGRNTRVFIGFSFATLALPIIFLACGGWVEWVTGRVPLSKERATQIEISNLIGAIETFKEDNDRFPTSAEGLDAMVHCPPGMTATWHLLVDEVPKDRWGRPYRYICPDPKDPGTFDVYSAGPDGVFGNGDDITKAMAR